MNDVVLYRVDMEKSLFTVHPFATGLGATLSHGLRIAVRDFTGEIRFVPGTLEKASIKMKIKADSLSVMEDMKDSDRREIENTMKTQVFRSAAHPFIEFRSSSVKPYQTMENHYRLEIFGELTVNGILCLQSFETIVVMGTDTLRVNGHIQVKQSDYKIAPITAGAGLIKVHDQVKLHFYLVAQRDVNGADA